MSSYPKNIDAFPDKAADERTPGTQVPKGHVARLTVASSSELSGGVSDLLYMKSAPVGLCHASKYGRRGGHF